MSDDHPGLKDPQFQAIQETDAAFRKWMEENSTNSQRELGYLLSRAFQAGVTHASGWKPPQPYKTLAPVQDALREGPGNGSWATIQQLDRMAAQYFGQDFAALQGTCGLLKYLFAMVRDNEPEAATKIVVALDGGANYRDPKWDEKNTKKTRKT